MYEQCTEHVNTMLLESTASNQVHVLNVKWNVLYENHSANATICVLPSQKVDERYTGEHTQRTKHFI